MAAKRGQGTVEHLRAYQWKPGQSGNPTGRPKGKVSLTQIVRELIDEPASLCPPVKAWAREIGLDPDKTSMGAVVAARIIVGACDGESGWMQELFNRIDGKVAERILGDVAPMFLIPGQHLAERLADKANEVAVSKGSKAVRSKAPRKATRK